MRCPPVMVSILQYSRWSQLDEHLTSVNTDQTSGMEKRVLENQAKTVPLGRFAEVCS
jgi:hypothetical protein